MPAYTTRLQLPSPLPGENADGPGAFTAINTILDKAAIDGQDFGANRPVSTVGTPGITGRWFKATDTGLISRDSGTGWDTLNPVDGPANIPTLRTLGTGPNQALPGNYSISGSGSPKRRGHSFTTNDLTSPTGTILGSFFIELAPGQTESLVEAVIHCVTVGTTPSVFKVRYDHGSHGSLTDVAGLAALQPSTTATIVTATAGPLILASLDRICVVVVTAGNSLGCTIDVKTDS